jgi:hypothetical protein
MDAYQRYGVRPVVSPYPQPLPHAWGRGAVVVLLPSLAHGGGVGGRGILPGISATE